MARIMEDFYDFSAKPEVAWLTVNRACNFRCAWCYAESSGFSPKRTMTLPRAQKLALLVNDLGIDHVTLTGGEPTLWPHLFQFVEYLHSLNMTCSMITNACRLGDDAFWAKYQENPVDSIGISIKGVTLDQFRSVTQTPKLFKTSLCGLQRAITFHDHTSIGTVYSSLTSVDDIKAIATATREYGADNFTLSPCGITFQDGVPSEKYVLEVDKLVAGIMQLYPTLDGLFSENFVLEMSLPFCFWPQDFLEKLLAKGQVASECRVQDRSGLVFDYDGDVLFCNNMLDNRIAEYDKDYRNASELLAHLNAAQMRQDYQEILRYPSESCSECTKRSICRGGCPLNWAVLPYEKCQPIREEGGDHEKVDQLDP